MSDTHNIWNDDAKGLLPEDKLLAYMEGRLSPEEQHEVEAWLAEEGMEADAIEGLQQEKSSSVLKSVNRLNDNLNTHLYKNRRRRKQISDNPFAWIAVVIILLLAVLAYVVIKMMK